MATDNLRAVFRRGGSDATANYDFFDLTSSTGYKKFNLLRLNEGDFLHPSDMPSNDMRTTQNSTTNTEMNFNYTFARPMTIKGDMHVSLVSEIIPSGLNNACYFIVRPLHVTSGGTETEIAAAVTSDTVSGGTAASLRVTFQFTCPQYNFGLGEKLRLEVKFYTTFGNGNIHFWHEPVRTPTLSNDFIIASAVNTPNSYIYVPFKVTL